MGGYLKPWQRKMGVVTLMLAVLFTGVWVRSLVVNDRIMIGDITGNYSVFYGIAGLGTSRHSIVLLTYEADTSVPTAPGVLKVMAFRLAPSIAIPLWPIACSLTLLTAYLLLGKRWEISATC